MLFQNPPGIPEEHQKIGTLNFYFFLAYIILLFVFGVLFYLKAKKTEAELNKKIYISYCLFGVLYGATRIFFIFSSNFETYYILFTSLGYSTGIVGYAAMISALEKVKYKKRYYTIIIGVVSIITIAGTVFVVLGLIFIQESIRMVIYIGTLVAVLLVFILYISLIKASIGIVRKKAIYSFLGLLIMFAGITIDSQLGLQQSWLPLEVKLYLSPALCIAGWMIFSILNLK